MALSATTMTMSAGVNYTATTDSSVDWTAVTNNSYFYDKTTKLVNYKTSDGVILGTYDTFTGGTINGLTATTISASTYSNVPVGIHAPRIPASGGFVHPLMLNYQPIANQTLTVNNLRCYPFIPMKTFSIVSYSLNVATAVASSNMRVLFYSDLNGLPNSKLYESTDIDTSTTGVKTVTQAYTFNAGTTYWLCWQTSAAIVLSSHSFNGGFAWQQAGATANLANNAQYTYALGSAPATLTTTGANYPTNNIPHLIFNI